MSQLTSEPDTADQSQLSRLCVAIRGKLQFMDYLVRAALADADRYRAETDPGTRIFIRQLVEMHAANLADSRARTCAWSVTCARLSRPSSTDRLIGLTMRETCHEHCKERNAPGNRPARRRRFRHRRPTHCRPALQAETSLAATAALQRSLADIKGQAQFLLYLADQIEDSLEQLESEADACHSSFLCKVLGMYSGQLESKHQGLGEKIAEACQEVYVTVRERELI